jgi:hypothetical protein
MGFVLAQPGGAKIGNSMFPVRRASAASKPLTFCALCLGIICIGNVVAKWLGNEISALSSIHFLCKIPTHGQYATASFSNKQNQLFSGDQVLAFFEMDF